LKNAAVAQYGKFSLMLKCWSDTWWKKRTSC